MKTIIVLTKTKDNVIIIELYFDNTKIIYFVALFKELQELNFRFQYYVIVKKNSIKAIKNNNTINNIKNINSAFAKSKNSNNFTFDFECIILIIDCNFLANKISYYIINCIAQLIRIRNIKDIRVYFSRNFLTRKVRCFRENCN